MRAKKCLFAFVLLSCITAGSAFAKVGIGLGPQWNGGAGSGATILFMDKMVINVGFPWGGYNSYGAGFGVGFDYLFGQYSITDFGTDGFLDFGWHWGVGGAMNFFFGGDGWYQDRSGDWKHYDSSFGFALGALPIVGLDLGFNINPEFKINIFLQYQPVIGFIINRPGFGGSPFWFEPWSFAGGVRFHF